MKIGLYLAYAPFPKDYSLKKEGLGRYLAVMTKGFVENGHKVVLACPKWSKDILTELFDEYNIDFNSLEVVTTQSVPLFLKLYYMSSLSGMKKVSTIKKQIDKASFFVFESIYNLLLSIKKVSLFIILFLISILFGIIILPIALLLGILLVLLKLILFVPKKILKIKKLDNIKIKSILLKIYNSLFMDSSKKKIKELLTKSKILEKMRIREADEIIKKIQMMKKPADVWYCPNSFWTEFNNIKNVTVTCVPDIVTEIFPVSFSSVSNVSDVTNNIIKTINNGKYFITYCNFVKKSVLENKLGIDSSRVRAILMFVNETLPDINVQRTYKNFHNANTFYARQILQYIPCQNSINPYYFVGERWFSMADIKYIFYSSQIRFSKNILNLISAYEYLLRREMITCKLFLTGNYDQSIEIKQYIINKGLENDVLCFYNVPNQQLAALYACAELVVNPTLYEGGFPFTFSEGMSVGTPSIMSKIPQVTEFTDGWDIDDCIFDPYNYLDIADKILYGLNNRDLLVKKQMPLYKMHSERTKNGQAIREYIEAFEYFIELDKKESE